METNYVWHDEIHYKNYKQENKDYQEIQISPGDIKDSFFPDPIKKILNGLVDGKKRGLFTFVWIGQECDKLPSNFNQQLKMDHLPPSINSLRIQ